MGSTLAAHLKSGCANDFPLLKSVEQKCLYTWLCLSLEHEASLKHLQMHVLVLDDVDDRVWLFNTAAFKLWILLSAHWVV